MLPIKGDIQWSQILNNLLPNHCNPDVADHWYFQLHSAPNPAISLPQTLLQSAPNPFPYAPTPTQSAPNPALRLPQTVNPCSQSAPSPAGVNMSTPTSLADPNISWSYSTLDKVLYKAAVSETWIILQTRGKTWRKFF